MTSPLRRRLLTLALAAAWPLAGRAASAVRSVDVTDLGADRSGQRDASAAFQQAIDQLAEGGGVLRIPAGTYRLERSLSWTLPGTGRTSGISFQGEGMHSTVLRYVGRSGPLLRVRGLPAQGPVSTTFFWGGGLRALTLDGSGAGPECDALELMGWWYGEIEQCRVMGFGRHGIRAVSDLAINRNPDFSASTMFVRSTWIERCGGWGFIDDGGVQVSPAWSWDRCVFVLCKQGGAFVQSSSHSYTKCSFSACGWQHENAAPADQAFGLYFAGALTATSRQWVEGCEFDNNLSAHIGARFLSSSSFTNNRFIFNDRYRLGRLCPAAGVTLGHGDARAAVRSVEFRQSFFRFDQGGQAVGFDWANTANVRDVEVSNSIFSDNSGGKLALQRYRGHEAAAQRMGYEIRDRDGDASRGAR
ncbi:hypothetical protein KAK07_00905 [Ideonella sp. 4Y16]|uniref:glycosyl hydrolase family 28-related protein n=1 Tax=Ideonella alba TaxID=2824118 RepID=UPI001B363B25|nr:glycosyl hydrolase family 28-related protein [Ideonella alba]MBQ0941883.1 hypothetical protein [Ideonella alba]